MRTTSKIAMVGALLLSSVFAAAPASATHMGTDYPDCVNNVPAASPGSYDVGRVQMSGYAGGTIAGLDLQLVDSVTPGFVPDVFKPDPAGGPEHIQVAGALVSVEMPGLQNTFLNNGPPTTRVAEDAFPVDLSTVDTHSGAQKVSMIFNGEITIHPVERFTCESVQQDNLLWTFRIQKVDLNGYATAITTADDAVQEPWGTGLNIQISPGDTSDA